MIAKPTTKMETYGNWAVKIIAVLLTFALMAAYNTNREDRQRLELLEKEKVDKVILEKFCDKQELKDKEIMEKLNQIQIDVGIVKSEIKHLNK